jgi:riboflavin kinase/FMN adenylyltransferase
MASTQWRGSRKLNNMRVYEGTSRLLAEASAKPLSSLGRLGSGTVLTIGNFDGVHLGHRELIRRTVEMAQRHQAETAVLTFEPHPLMALRPDLGLKRLYDPDDRAEQMQALGVDLLVVEPFSREFSQLAPDRFFAEVILRAFSPRALVVGYDFSFGANRSGGTDFLRERCQAAGLEFAVVPPVHVGSGVVSSTRIRQALSEGDAEAAQAMLGRPYSLRGIVKKGAGRGRAIGIPTANLDLTVECPLRGGVYVAWAKLRGRKEAALVNIGQNPTFNDGPALHVEAHLPEFKVSVDPDPRAQDLYGERLEIEFIARLRDEKKFSGVEALVGQIRQDIDIGLQRLRQQHGSKL